VARGARRAIGASPARHRVDIPTDGLTSPVVNGNPHGEGGLIMAFDPFNELLRFQAEIDRLQRNPVAGFLAGPSGPGVFPPVNVFRGRDGLVVHAELPGVAPEDVSVTCEGRRLTITGQRKPMEGEHGGYHRRERPVGKFARTFLLPEDLDAARASAEVRNGLLTVRVPVAEAARPRQITVRAS
jgi:HSP20 family protein